MIEFYGDDQSLIDVFENHPAKVYFGFSSVNAFVEHVENLPVQNRDRTNAYHDNSSRLRFTGTNDMNEALNLAKNGWVEGAEKAIKITELFRMEKATVKRYMNSISGGFTNVPRMLAGNPVHMRKKQKNTGNKNIEIFIDFSNASAISAENMILRACVVAAIIDMTERAGYSCELTGVQVGKFLNKSFSHCFVVKLKNAGECLNLNDLVFALGHPSFLRRMIFASVGNVKSLRTIWNNQGCPHELETDEIYIGMLQMIDQRFVNDQVTETDKIKKMFELIVANHSKLLGSQLSI